MKNLIPAFVLLLSPLAASAETGALPAFNFTDAARLRAEKFEIALPAPRVADVITRNYMIISAGKDVLFGRAATQEQFAEAAAYWSEILKAAGIKPGMPAYDKDGFFTLPYRTTDGRVLRAFLAEPRQFPPKDELRLRENMAFVKTALTAAGLTPVSARVVSLEDPSWLLPTYSILYLARPETVREHEKQLRVFMPGEAIDVDLIKLAPGVTVVQQPEPWLLVYIGPEVGYIGLIAKTEEELALHLEKRKALLVEAGKRIIAEKLFAVDHAEYKFGVAILFFQ